MFKRTLAILVSVLISTFCTIVCSAEGYDDSNTNADNTITDTVNWLASDVYEIGDKLSLMLLLELRFRILRRTSKAIKKRSLLPVAGVSDTSFVSTGLIVKRLGSGENFTVVVNGDIKKYIMGEHLNEKNF